jgi:hypothetical protein
MNGLLPPSATPYTPQPVYPLIRYHDWRTSRCRGCERQPQKFDPGLHGDDEPVHETTTEICSICQRNVARHRAGRTGENTRSNIRSGQRGGVGRDGHRLADAQPDIERDAHCQRRDRSADDAECKHRP